MTGDLKCKRTKAQREYWAFVERTAAEVATWKNGLPPSYEDGYQDGLKAGIKKTQNARRNAMSKRNGRTIYVVTVEDLTHLGGPMGTEYTTTLSARRFMEQTRALAYARKWLVRHLTESHARFLGGNPPSWEVGGNTITPKTWTGKCLDLGSRGISVTTEKLR